MPTLKCGKCRKYKSKCNCGRPDSFTPELVDKLRQAFAIGCTVGEACLFAEIDRKTFYNHCPEGSELFLKFQALRDKPVLKARNTVVSKLDEAETAKWYLERRRKKEFSTRQESELGPDTSKLLISWLNENNDSVQSKDTVPGSDTPEQ